MNIFIQPPPPEFKEEFEKGGWEAIENLYPRKRTDLLRKWIHMTGAKCRNPRAVKKHGGGK